MTKLTKMIYLASPYSANTCNKYLNKLIQKKRYEQVTQAAADLQEEYEYAFILPITMSHNTTLYMADKDTGFATWKQRDLTYISKCDEVWVLTIPGWDLSIGVLAEIEYAKRKKIPVYVVYRLKDAVVFDKKEFKKVTDIYFEHEE